MLKIDLSGQTIKGKEILSYEGAGRWKYKCSCGVVNIASNRSIQKNKGCKSCVGSQISKSNIKNVNGKRYGKLVVIGIMDDFKRCCVCDCGNFCSVVKGNLESKTTKSCGCLKTSPKPERRKDLSGQTVHNISILSPSERKDRKGQSMFFCKCHLCYNFMLLSGNKLQQKSTKSCGCLKSQNSRNTHMIGKKYGRLTVLSRSKSRRNTAYYICQCECGNIKEIRGNGLRTKTRPTISCGCLRKENLKRGKEHHNWKEFHVFTDRDSSLLKQLKGLAKRRDGNFCQKCNKTNKLCLHHIFNFNDYEDLRYEIENLILLCRDCHVDFHRKNGTSFNNLNQIIEFLGKELPFEHDSIVKYQN